MDFLMTSTFWIALLQIIIINIILSGDNAVVIALAARSLPPAQQKKAIIGGSVAAIVMRVVLTIAAVSLLSLPYLKLVGAVLLLYIGVQLLLEEDEAEEHHSGTSNLMAAIRTILIADLVMSLDNVLGVAAAAKGDVILLIVGLAISIPLIIFGSTIILKLMERFPIIITGGAALLGWVAGEMFISDPATKAYFEGSHVLHYVIPGACAVAVVAIGKFVESRKTATA